MKLGAFLKQRHLGVALFAIVLCGLNSTASAVVLSANSNANGLNFTLTYTDTTPTTHPTATAGPVAPISRTAPPIYVTGNSVSSFTQNDTPTQTTSTGAISDSVLSNVDGTAGSRTTSAISAISGLTQSIVPGASGGALLSLSVGSISVTSTVTGDVGSFTPTGSTAIAGLTVKVLGNLVTTPALPAPNTMIALIANGVTFANLILNEQIVTNTATSSSITTNAIDIKFTGNAVSGVGTVTGSEIIGHTFAMMGTPTVAAPEPSQVALMGLVAAALGVRYLKSRRRRTLPVLEPTTLG